MSVELLHRILLLRCRVGVNQRGIGVDQRAPFEGETRNALNECAQFRVCVRDKVECEGQKGSKGQSTQHGKCRVTAVIAHPTVVVVKESDVRELCEQQNRQTDPKKLHSALRIPRKENDDVG